MLIATIQKSQKVATTQGKDTLEKEVASHSCILAWEITWTEEPGRLQSMGLQRVRHDLGLSTTTTVIFESSQ